MGTTVHTCQRSEYFLHLRVPTRGAWNVLRFVPVAADTGLVGGGGDVGVDNCNCILGVLPGVWANIDLREHSDHKFTFCHPVNRPGFCAVGVRRILSGVGDGEPVFRPPFSVALCVVGAGFCAPADTACPRLVEPSGGKRERGPAGDGTIFFVQGPGHSNSGAALVQCAGFLFAEHSWSQRQLFACQPYVDTGKYRAGVVFVEFLCHFAIVRLEVGRGCCDVVRAADFIALASSRHGACAGLNIPAPGASIFLIFRVQFFAAHMARELPC